MSVQKCQTIITVDCDVGRLWQPEIVSSYLNDTGIVVYPFNLAVREVVMEKGYERTPANANEQNLFRGCFFEQETAHHITRITKNQLGWSGFVVPALQSSVTKIE